MSQLTTGSFRTRSTGVALPVSIVSAAIVSVALDAVIAAVAHGAGASDEFPPLMLPAYTFLSVLGLLIGGIAWAVVRAKAANPAGFLRIGVPIVVLVSFVPDIMTGISKAQPGTTWGAVAALMVMHIVVAAVGVAAFNYFMPVRQTDQA
ncbi:DUF6069 family protein [Umezawaea sp. Da 62-37]|uniref:DUF6069 family protein n=1 Tax=Umezawaea sp. Da 62-37 TaxID=3075927 RepID=UPI0028F721A3|nr:DUF6069 family protein [Umezawaea sp. Da 62-37]WNV89243.1 DUF6069 family protein [Umezawaea sp. Da 62-37]